MNDEPTIRNITCDDVPKIVRLQEESFPFMAAQGIIWKPEHLRAHIELFPEGQFCAEIDGKIIGSCSSLIITLNPEYRKHSWYEACGDAFFKNHDPSGDTLYAADVSTHPDYRRYRVATKMYDVRKQLAIRMNLRRIIAGGRLFNYCEYAKKMSPEEYVMRVIAGEISEPVLLFQLKNDFKFIKILPDYLTDERSLNNAAFIEWKNPHYVEKK